MSRFFAPRLFAVMTTFSLLIGSWSHSARAANPAANDQAAPQPQDVFAAIQAGDLEVGVVPQNERRLTIQMKNKTDRPLTIMLPPALAAGPILAQQPVGLFGGGLNQQGQNGQQQSPQQVGVGMNGGNNGGGRNMFPGGMFNIPAGRAIKIKAETVCLEYGKPNPDSRMAYELKPLADVCDKPELAAVLTSLGKDEINQRAAQAAAWHLTNDMTWDELAKLVHRKVGSTVEMQFKSAELAAAKAFLAKQNSGSSSTPSQGSLSQMPKGEGKTATAWASGGFRSFGFNNNGRTGGGVVGGGNQGGTGGGVGQFGGGGFGGAGGMPGLPGGFGGGGGGVGGFAGANGGVGGGGFANGGAGGGAGGNGGIGGGGFAGGGGGGVLNGGGGGSANASTNGSRSPR